MAHGAVGNGLADDTAAITRALAAAGPGGTVLFDAGRTFKTTSLITIPHDAMTLNGYSAVITSASESQYRKFLFSSRTRGTVLGLRFECIHSSGGTGISNGCIEIANSTDITIRDCTFNDVKQIGVYVSGASARCTIESNRFYRNYCAIFSDDDGGSNQPLELNLRGNEIRSGLGATSDAFSGGIKISGTPTDCHHVIIANQIIAPGEMGIEVQGPNQFTIQGNVVSGAGYGISVSDTDRVTVGGNTVRAATVVGLEVASNSQDVTVANNVVRLLDVNCLSIASNTKNVNVLGNNFYNETNGYAVHMAGSINSTIFANHIGGMGTVYLQNANNASVVANTFAAHGAGTFAAIWFDATNAAMTGCQFSHNRVTGGYVNSVVMFYSPNGHPIRDILIEGNNTKGCNCAAGAFNAANSLVLQRIRCFNNIGEGTADSFTTDLSVPIWTVSSNQSFPYAYFYLEGALVNFNANSAPIGFQLPNASGMGKYSLTLRKTDSSSNAVVVSGYAGATIDGYGAISLNSQYAKASIYCDGANWLITQSGIG